MFILLKNVFMLIRLLWVALAMLVNLLVMSSLFYIAGLLRLVPYRPFSQAMRHLVVLIAEQWIANNSAILSLGGRTQYDVQIPDGLQRDQSYMVICNHQAWTDILVLQKVFNRKVPFFRFFIKQDLLWVPILGPAWWMLDFPVMKRYTREQLEKNPHLRGKDRQMTIDRCERLAGQPLAMLNFLEGTRFEFNKHQLQCSPYRYLLKPRSAGLAYTLNSLPALRSLLNITLIYPEGKASFIQFLAGKTAKVIVRAELMEVPEEFTQGNYEEDREFKNDFQQWVTGLWTRKDQQIVDYFHVEALKRGLSLSPLHRYGRPCPEDRIHEQGRD